MGTKRLTCSLVFWKHFLVMMAKASRGPAMPQALFSAPGLLKSTIHITGSASAHSTNRGSKIYFF